MKLWKCVAMPACWYLNFQLSSFLQMIQPHGRGWWLLVTLKTLPAIFLALLLAGNHCSTSSCRWFLRKVCSLCSLLLCFALVYLVVKLTHFWLIVRGVEEIERPLAKSLEGWVLQQAVTGLILEGQLEQAEALCTQVNYQQAHFTCNPISLWKWEWYDLNLHVPLPCLSQVLNVSPENPAVMLSLRQVQYHCLLMANSDAVLPDPVLEHLNKAVIINPTNLGAWHVSAYTHNSSGASLSIMVHRFFCHSEWWAITVEFQAQSMKQHAFNNFI